MKKRLSLLENTYLVFISSIFGSAIDDYKSIVPALTQNERAHMEIDGEEVHFYFRYEEKENVYVINGISIHNQVALRNIFDTFRTIEPNEIGPEMMGQDEVGEHAHLIFDMINAMRETLDLRELTDEDRIILCIHWGGDQKSEALTFSQNLERCFYFFGKKKIWGRHYTRSNKMYGTIFQDEKYSLEEFFTWGYLAHFIEWWEKFAFELGRHQIDGEAFQTEDENLIFLWEKNHEDYVYLWNHFKDLAQVSKSIEDYLVSFENGTLHIYDLASFHKDSKKIEYAIKDFLCEKYDYNCPKQ